MGFEFQLDERASLKRLADEMHAGGKSQTEIFGFTFQIRPPNVFRNLFRSIGTRNYKANEVKPPAVEMPSGFHTAHAIDFCFAVRPYSQSLEQSTCSSRIDCISLRGEVAARLATALLRASRS